MLLDYEFLKYIDYTGKNVFPDATVDPCIIVVRKCIPNSEHKIIVNNTFEIPQNRLNDGSWSFSSPELFDLRDKIESKGVNIKEIEGISIYYGIKTAYDKAFVIDESTKDNLIREDKNTQQIIRPVLGGRDIEKWRINYKNKYLLYIPWNLKINEYPAVKNYLEGFKEGLQNRTGAKNGNYSWFALHRYAPGYYQEFQKEKIIWSELSSQPSFSKDTDGIFLLASMFLMTIEDSSYNINYLLAILNSKVQFWIFKHITSTLGNKGLRYFKQFVEQLPIYPASSKQQKPYIEKAERMLLLNKRLNQTINSFKKFLSINFDIEKFSKKLEKYYNLSEKELFSELKKNKVKMSSKNINLISEEFQDNIKLINPLLLEIEKTDNEIDQMVYESYGLTDDEIEIVEKSLGSSYKKA